MKSRFIFFTLLIVSISTAYAAKPTKEQRNKAVIMNVMNNINKHDIAAAVHNYAPDFVEYGDGSMPPVHGDTVLQMYIAAFPDLKSENFIYCADGDYVMVYSDVTGTWKGALGGMQPTNTSIKIKDVDVFKLNAVGKVVEHHNIQNVGCVLSTAHAAAHK